MEQRKTRQIHIGEVAIGGGAPVSIQSMTNTATADWQATAGQIVQLAAEGCQIARVAVPDHEAAEALPKLIAASPLPIIADIHFDYRLALAALAAGVAGLRLNPGNIGGPERVIKVVEAAKAKHIPIRVGVNGGSLEKTFLAKYGGVTAQGLAESALAQVALLEKMHFYDIKISVKSSNIPMMLEAYRLLAQKTDCPFHIGVTEAGTLRRGSIKSAAGIGAMLGQGMGDTIRVSLAGDPVNEIFVAKEILKSFDLAASGVEYIICPTCGRTKVDIPAMAAAVEEQVEQMHLNRPLKIAVMGCVVNGPGEAAAADCGIAGGNGEGLVFAGGRIIGKYPDSRLVEELIKEIQRLVKEDTQ